MKSLAIIPILPKSEFIPKMFSRFLVNKPLVLYICEAAKKSKNIEDLYIFTEDDNIAHIAEINNINFINNSSFLKETNTSLDDLIIKIWDKIESIENKKYNFIITLQPNCPLIKSETIDKSIEETIFNGFDSAISVKYQEDIGLHYWKEDQNGIATKILNNTKNDPDLFKRYRELKGIIISKRSNLVQNRSLLGGKVKLIELDLPENLQITNHIDWWIADKFLRRKRILIRVDGYNRIGLGHIYRTISIANQLMDHNILFVSNKEHDLGINLIKEHKYPLRLFSDFQEYKGIINEFKPNIIINDILDTDLEYITDLKKKNIFVVNFEDLGEGTKKADLVINALYKQKNFEANHYWGKDYYILREEFQIIPQKRVNKDIRKILITFGGTDPNNYTEKVLNIINDLNLRDIKIFIILGLGYKHDDRLRETVKKFNLDVKIKKHISHISKYMYEADIAFTSAGRTVYELASIGTPTIVLVENERGLMHTFANENNGIINLGLGYEITNQKIKDALMNLISDYDLRIKNNHLMLSNNLRSGINNVISLIFSQYENYINELNI